MICSLSVHTSERDVSPSDLCPGSVVMNVFSFNVAFVTPQFVSHALWVTSEKCVVTKSILAIDAVKKRPSKRRAYVF